MKPNYLNRASRAVGCLSLLAAPLHLANAINITINDTISSSGSWYGSSEIHEVEPNCDTGHSWDLEAFTLSGNRLSMIGGYDFKNGYGGTTSGSLFFDINGDARYGTAAVGLAPSGNGNQATLNPFGFDYAAVFNFENNTFNLFSLNATSPMLTGFYGQNAGSNPWSYNWQNDANRNLVLTGAITYESGLSSATVISQYGVDASSSGARHYVVSLDLPTLFSDRDILTHFTMSCGNDNLVGSGHVPGTPQTPGDNPPASVPDGGSSGLMLGLGLATMGILRRKFRTPPKN